LETFRFSLEFTPSAEHVGTVRIFGGAIARHFGFHESDIEDLKIALTEACANALQHRAIDSDGSIQVRAEMGTEELSFEVEGARAGQPPIQVDSEERWGQTSAEQALALGAELITTLFPDAQFVEGPSGTWLRFSVRPKGLGDSLA
jgi:anti-sigma regulatory factor (Ser/Thr protein kinase)